ncbi:hypothetical protein AGABI1DRAFT_110546 [Agaricus bisporus var. burnettii JB137-S8]|uniref:Uncharacterized protein n=1 Tax=Agaricus bisporus var. burnettii (strain JB137-S8 / ATCC MYA-4627 / FGSC 10392) TaxID=597362 RepID=K5X7P0_AGABU|nr:uncharacterized protein AGABI1DRAFT_110546 [Agaricus bisporus var. burnettii JB137-S8]EKM83936.1 hypothetical protein AGABI1DRAFT_110546 [Agaricus bisporus var. burnettii JB137-S8]
MKIPSSSSFLLATLAVSSSSSALIPPSADTHQEAPLSSAPPSSASAALIASSSSGSLVSQQTGFSQRGLIQESMEQRGILDIVPLACQLAHTLTDNLPTPVPELVGVLCSPTPKDGKGAPSQAKAHKELSRISDALQRAVFVSAASVSSSSSTVAAVAPSDGVSGDNGRVDAVNSTSLPSNSSESSSALLMPSASSTAFRFQPTPTNSPSLPVDDPEAR